MCDYSPTLKPSYLKQLKANRELNKPEVTFLDHAKLKLNHANKVVELRETEKLLEESEENLDKLKEELRETKLELSQQEKVMSYLAMDIVWATKRTDESLSLAVDEIIRTYNLKTKLEEDHPQYEVWLRKMGRENETNPDSGK